jgi:hypothetical protein
MEAHVNRLFWYGSLVAPILVALLVTVLAMIPAVLSVAGVISTEDVGSLVPWLTLGSMVLMVPILLWYTGANMVAFFRVMTDPDNDKKLLWAIGWTVFNLGMHVAYLWVYVHQASRREA